ncbi:nuclear transport factor 2 family protein [Aeromicrobium sp. CFBP 8757]|uniref:nuclear transport factor 2 family protein n=1 Tax=Aeromicrobium sp. CFBP 8757 TaxID=2775288 RepID=UPI0017865C6A|nr:nuclear transport factor 2 family protein [Aeromicrobium sp. CFBP 8757]MBD8605469.1 nuclear transport factor 2 family protein [Aeromicrobium sp. CFBP 8757]
MITIVDPTDTKAVRNIENVLALYEGMINNKTAVETVPEYVAEGYIQHNPVVPDGVNGLAQGFGYINSTRPVSRVEVHRLIASGDWVYAHVNFRNLYNDDPADRGVAGVDIYRMNDEGKTVEHWDVLQPVGDPADAAHANGMF